MQAALAKVMKSSGYGTGSSSPNTGGLFNPRAAYLANNRAIRRADARDAMQYQTERAAWRGGTPIGGGATAMPTVDGATPFQQAQEAASNAHAEQQAAYSLINALRGDEPVDAQLLRNRGLSQLYQAGNLAQDEPAMNAVTPQRYHSMQLEASGQKEPSETSSTTKTVVEQAQDAAARATGQPTNWERTSELFKNFRLPEDAPAVDIGRALDRAAGEDPALVTPGLLMAIRQHLMSKIGPSPTTGTAPDPSYYVPGTRGGFFSLPSTNRGYTLLDMLIGNENPQPGPILDLHRSGAYSPLGDREYWKQQVPEGQWFPAGGGF